MKKLLLATPPLLLPLLFSNPAFAVNPTAGLNSCGGFEAGIEGFWARTNSDDLDYTIVDFQDNDLLPDNDVPPRGNIKSIHPDHDWGFEAYVGYILPCLQSDIVLSYKRFDQNDSERSNAFADSFVWTTHLPPDFIDDFIDGPAGEQAAAASAKVDFDYHKWSLDYGHYLRYPCGLNLRYVVGVDHANIDRKIRRHYFDVELRETINSDFPITGIQREKSDFNGWGPKVGLDADFCVGQGFGLIGHATTSLLIGKVDYNYFATLVDPAGDVIVEDEADIPAIFDVHGDYKHHVVPNVNVKVGVDYTYRFCNCTRTSLVVELGYQVDHYFDAFHSINFNSVGTEGESGTFTKNYSSFDLHGPYLNVSVVL